MGSEGELWTTRQVAEYLGVGVRMVHYYLKTGRLRSVPQRRRHGRSHLFKVSEVELLLKWRAEQNPATLEEAIMRSLRAEALALDTARQLAQLYDVLGLGYELPDMTIDGVCTAYHHAKSLSDPNGPAPDGEEAIDLAKTILRFNEEYLRLVERQMSDPEPWHAFADALVQVLDDFRSRRTPTANIAIFYLVSAQRHLRHVAFEFVRTCHGHIKAEQLVEQTPDQVNDEIVAIMLSNSKIN